MALMNFNLSLSLKNDWAATVFRIRLQSSISFSFSCSIVLLRVALLGKKIALAMTLKGYFASVDVKYD